MPSMNKDLLIDTTAAGTDCITIFTNAELSRNPHRGFVYSAKLDTQYAGRTFDAIRTQKEALSEMRALDVVLPPKSKAVIFNELALDRALHNHQADNNVYYFTVQEMVSGISAISGNPITNFPHDSRLLRVMTPLILEQDGKKYIPLTLRGEGATSEGLWGCSSKLLGETLTETFIQSVAKSELVVSVNGAALDTFELRLPENPYTVSIHGGHANDTLKCFASDNPEQRILTLVFPMVATLPTGNHAVSNIEHPQDHAQLVDIENASRMNLMPGLREYILGGM